MIGTKAMRYWLVKSEPESFSWTDLVKAGVTQWTGVRNFQARNNLRSMGLGDPVLFYHSVSEKQIVGIAEVSKTAFQDPTSDDPNWICVELRPKKPLALPITLEAIKKDKTLSSMPLVKHSRLSVMPLEKAHFERIIKLSKMGVGKGHD
jgi:predicted RNA-binding protein with PUA-like domain